MPETKHSQSAEEGKSAGESHIYPWPAASWITADLQRMVDNVKPGGVIGEVGCMAGEYVRALRGAELIRLIIDLPFHCSKDTRWPAAEDSTDLLICVNTFQCTKHLEQFYSEAARVVRTTKLFVLVTPTPADIKAGGLGKFFPELLAQAESNFADVQKLEKALAEAGLPVARRGTLSGTVSLDGNMLALIKSKHVFGLKSLGEMEFAAGLDRMKRAIGEGDASWPLQYTILAGRKPHPYRGAGQAAPKSMGMSGEMGEGMGGGMGGGKM